MILLYLPALVCFILVLLVPGNKKWGVVVRVVLIGLTGVCFFVASILGGI